MKFRLFGPVELWAHGSRIDLGPSKSRLLLAVLLMEAGRTVPFDALVERVWDEDPPAKVAVSVHAVVSRLRRRLALAGDESVRLEFVSPIGYRLLISPERVDVLEFTRLVIQGQAAAGGGSRERAISLLQAAEVLVRGEPLAGLPGSWARATRAGLLERCHAAALSRLRLQLECEDPRSLLGELRELAARHPLDETVAGLLMRALHGSGRTGDALEVYNGTRRELRSRLGIDPHRPLNEIHRLVLRGEGDPSAHFPSAARNVEPLGAPNTLERDPVMFVGRREDVNSLLGQISARLEQQRSVLCVIDGMPGVGKTTLALRLAHALRDRCPDGALHIHLRGHDPLHPPTAPHGALHLLLTMLGADTRELQHDAGLDHAMGLWRRITAGRRLVVVLDDAVDEQQIHPLMPGGTATVVVVTSRQHLTELPDAIHHTLPLMPQNDARALFASAARVSPDHSPTALERILKTCGRLPLALTIAGGFLRARPSWSLDDFADHLEHSLSSDGTDTLGKRLDATFETSYRNLPQLARAMLRRLALHPGGKISLNAAAALADASPPDADMALDVLVEHHLLIEPERHRYQMHDLLRGFAAHVLARDETTEQQQAATDRYVRFRLDSVEYATRLFHPHRHANLAADGSEPSPVTPLSFADAQHASAWLDEEQSLLRSEAEHWHAHGRAREAAALSHMLAMYLDRRGLWRESVRLHENALHTWLRLGHVPGQAFALGDLATARWRLGALEPARFCSETALTLWSGLGDVEGQADALLQIGRAHHYAHRQTDAIRCYTDSASLRSDAGDRLGEAEALYHRGVVMFDTGRHDDGVRDTRRALELARSLHDATIERNCVNNLGEFHRQRGEYDQALACYRSAVSLAEQIGDPRNIAVAALNLGEISSLLDDPREAQAYLELALEIFARLGAQTSVVNTLLAQSRAHEQLGQHEQSAAALREAASIADQLADPQLSAHVNLTRGTLHERRGDHSLAIAAYRKALSHSLAANALLEQAAAHHGIGNVLARGPRPSSAKPHWRAALDVFGPLRTKEADELRGKLEEPGAASA